jgi:hypothetical protein
MIQYVESRFIAVDFEPYTVIPGHVVSVGQPIANLNKRDKNNENFDSQQAKINNPYISMQQSVNNLNVSRPVVMSTVPDDGLTSTDEAMLGLAAGALCLIPVIAWFLRLQMSLRKTDNARRSKDRYLKTPKKKVEFSEKNEIISNHPEPHLTMQPPALANNYPVYFPNSSVKYMIHENEGYESPFATNHACALDMEYQEFVRASPMCSPVALKRYGSSDNVIMVQPLKFSYSHGFKKELPQSPTILCTINESQEENHNNNLRKISEILKNPIPGHMHRKCSFDTSGNLVDLKLSKHNDPSKFSPEVCVLNEKILERISQSETKRFSM